MSTTFTTTAAITPTDLVDSSVTRRTRFWRVGIISGAVAAVATCITVLAARAGDVDVAIDGERVPLDGFALFTMVGALIGVALARTFSRRAQSPRTTFVRTTVALTFLSIVPDFIVPATTGSRLVLAVTHVVAAAIIVPALAARLHD
jgi:peptidoglycan/LPS O-acetylase OafA/YrhL